MERRKSVQQVTKLVEQERARRITGKEGSGGMTNHVVALVSTLALAILVGVTLQEKFVAWGLSGYLPSLSPPPPPPAEPASWWPF